MIVLVVVDAAEETDQTVVIVVIARVDTEDGIWEMRQRRRVVRPALSSLNSVVVQVAGGAVHECRHCHEPQDFGRL